MEAIIALVALTAMEIVLGIDNIVFITILTDRLPKDQQPLARRLGLAAALVTRLMLLATLKWILALDSPLFSLDALGIPASWLSEEVLEVSTRDLILLGGGLFLIANSVREIHVKMEGHEEHHAAGPQISFASVMVQIALLDIIFSLDSVITAVGMAKELWVMMTAVIFAVGVMILFANAIGEFVSRHPTLKMLALSFLILIGVMLVAEGIGTHFDKGYIYFAMFFSLVVEGLNLRVASQRKAKPAT